MAKCETENCSNERTSRSTFCANCRSSFYYWSRKRTAQIVERREKLKLYASRISLMITRKKA